MFENVPIYREFAGLMQNVVDIFFILRDYLNPLDYSKFKMKCSIMIRILEISLETLRICHAIAE